MHQLFLSSIVYGRELDFYLRVMQGVCAMQPNHTFRRQVIFEGPRDRKFLGVPAQLMKQNSPKAQEWQKLHEPLSRQAYYLTGYWEVAPEQFGKRVLRGKKAYWKKARVMDLNASFGTLRWLDWPDPANVRKLNSRQIVQIENERNLLETMKAMHHRIWAENVRECYQFVHENIVIEFTRYFSLSKESPLPLEQVSTRLPPQEDLILFDRGGEDKWVVTAYLLVLNGTDQDLMQDGVQELRAFQELLKDSLDFEETDRHELDTRVK